MKNVVKIILIVLVLLSFTGIGAYAATVLSSDVVSFDNSNGMNSGNVKDAIDELYTMANNSSGGRLNFSITFKHTVSSNNTKYGGGDAWIAASSSQTYDVTNYKTMYLSKAYGSYNAGINDISNVTTVTFSPSSSIWINQGGDGGATTITISGYFE